VLLFGILAIEVKQKAPTAHTFLELVYARWGKTSHIVFMVYAFMCNMIVSAMLLLGGAAVVNALTGVDLNLASFLIPWGVIAYTLAGGLKATFLASYFNTAIIFAVLIYFVFVVYASSPLLGDAGTVYDKLTTIVSYPRPTEDELAAGYHCGRVSGNRGGSYLTMLSTDGLVFGASSSRDTRPQAALTRVMRRARPPSPRGGDPVRADSCDATRTPHRAFPESRKASSTSLVTLVRGSASSPLDACPRFAR